MVPYRGEMKEQVRKEIGAGKISVKQAVNTGSAVIQ